ncbi:MAG TPA: 50S ribosomal protein L25 [Candidatus Saccharimonadales bacterium]|nr:50S ribosomal protein L25 [Candidatus Saccharimonadales bacterium]
MQRQSLKVEKRTTLGKKLKKLRRDGLFPANIYGRDIKSLAVQLPYKDFEHVFKEAGETGLVDVHVEGEVRPVLIHNVQIDPLSRMALHADFYQVNLKEKIKAMVPVELIGEPKAVTDKVGLLMPLLSEVEVEALPTDLPEKLDADVSHLAAIDDQLAVADLKTPSGVTILTDPNQAVAKIAELVSKEAAEQAAAEEAAKEAAKAEGAEGEAAEGAQAAEKAEGEKTEAKPAEEPKKEEKKE